MGEISRRLLHAKPGLARMLTNYTLRQWFPPMLLDMRAHQAKNDNYGLEQTEATLRELFWRNPLYWLYVYPALKVPLRFRGALQRLTMFVNQAINFLTAPAEGMHKLTLARRMKSQSLPRLPKP